MSGSAESPYDALLIVSFGGPEKRDDVIPFLENVLRGKPVTRERMLEVAEHYYHFDGISPINGQVRNFIEALRGELNSAGIVLPIYWGNRNWQPMLADTLTAMKQDGIRRALAFMTSAYSSYSGCRQYREDLQRASDQVGPGTPQVEKLRVFYNHPGFIDANRDRIRAAIATLPADVRATAPILFTAHSIPLSMSSNCDYVQQLNETCRLVAESLEVPQNQWRLVYQSRSGRPGDPWLEPDILDEIRRSHADGTNAIVIAPIGFISDHMEVLYDLDVEARQLCDELGMTMARSGTVGVHPEFLSCVRELIEERLGRRSERRAIGRYGPNHDVCPVDCCQYSIPQRPRPA